MRDKLCVTVARGNAVEVKRVNMAGIKRLKTTRRRLDDVEKRSNTLAKALAVQRTKCAALEERLTEERAKVGTCPGVGAGGVLTDAWRDEWGTT